ncbi:MAG: MFS transporter [Coriobacteriia bacterium]|nr:MFS transporter [Coriobacteriia bacterium]
MTESASQQPTKHSWVVIGVLAAAQFVMVIDATVMNVSISKIVADLGTTVVGIQTAITAFTLVMAAFMLTGGKLGNWLGAKRAFGIGLLVYGTGSLLTALSQNLGQLLVGWSLLEGLGAVLVIPAIAALTSANYSGKQRALSFGILGGVAGAAAAAGPIIGGLVTTYASWRYVFAAETIMCIGILLASRRMASPERAEHRRFDALGAALSIVGLGMFVFGVLQSSQWGWITPSAAAPIAPLGYSPVMWLVLAGSILIALFIRWESRVMHTGGEPLLDLSLLRIPTLRAGLSMLAVQQFVVAGTFFVLPLYLQTVLGLDALDTGMKLLPLSACLLVFALGGSALTSRFGARAIARIGIIAILASELTLQISLDPNLRSLTFALALGLLGSGLGMLASQLGNVNLSSVPVERGAEVGGLQGTVQNMGASLGTALVGAMLISTLGTGFVTTVRNNPALPPAVLQAVSKAKAGGLDFVSSEVVEKTATDKGLRAADVSSLVQDYQSAQINALKLSVGLLAIFALLGLWFVKDLPGKPE